MKSKIREPFDITYSIEFSGITLMDGVPTTTTPMIRDKIIYLLEECIAKGYISDYKVSAMRNNITEAKKILRKAEKHKKI